MYVFIYDSIVLPINYLLMQLVIYCLKLTYYVNLLRHLFFLFISISVIVDILCFIVLFFFFQIHEIQIQCSYIFTNCCSNYYLCIGFSSSKLWNRISSPYTCVLSLWCLGGYVYLYFYWSIYYETLSE